MKRARCIFLTTILFTSVLVKQTAAQELYHEMHRPQVHFSPKEKWMNDPNGMVYYKGIYHLFFQHYPDSTIWGPMHWGHATSKDLVHWHQEPIALSPDSLGYIFSGSAVVDKNNTTGFAKKAGTPLVAIFTHHDPAGVKAKRNNYQNQSLAYSLNDGKTWTKYAHNPVLKNPGITDFRDPKVMWYAPQKKWIMTLATNDRVTFYASPDLKDWKKESEFGKESGAHDGVWECPDLFSLDDGGKKIWVLVVSLNPGGPNGGSATQYFLGEFDGNRFTPFDTKTKWLDYGPDEYAGITWSNTGSRKLFLGWMTNWLYANEVPTEKWRSAMTIPRELKLQHVGKDILVASLPVRELNQIQSTPVTAQNVLVARRVDIAEKTKTVLFPCRIDLNVDSAKDFSMVLSNDLGEEMVIGYDKALNQYYMDRTKSGKIDFQKDFGKKHTAPRFTQKDKMDISIIIDASSVELFADNGLTVMTAVFFPNKPYQQVHLQSADSVLINKLTYTSLGSIWE